MTTLRTRRPSGAVPWPLVLIEGPEKSGKSFMAAEFTASDRIGQAYWLDLGEGAADEYAAIPGADYLVLVHDGTWPDILGQVQAVHAEAARAASAAEKPVVLVIDSMSAEWDLLKDWTSARARDSRAGKAALAKDPDAEVRPAMNLWNDANGRHARLMHLLMTFPGIVLITARGKEVAALDNAGKPIPGAKEYRVEGHKNIAFDATAWVRLSRDAEPMVVGVRSVHAGLRPGTDKPQREPKLSIEWLVFELMRCNPAVALVRDHVQTSTDEPQQTGEPDWVDRARAAIRSAQTLDEVNTIAIQAEGIKAADRRWKAELIGMCDSRKRQIAADAEGGQVDGRRVGLPEQTEPAPELLTDEQVEAALETIASATSVDELTTFGKVLNGRLPAGRRGEVEGLWKARRKQITDGDIADTITEEPVQTALDEPGQEPAA